jgi:hypothetical protein
MFWPIYASPGIVFTLTLVCGLPGLVSFVMIPVSLLGYMVAGLVLLIAAGIFFAKRRTRQAASLLLGLIMPALLWTPINWAADCAHLGLTVGLGINRLVPSTGDNFEVSDWSVGLAGGPNTFLIHDKTDRIAIPLTQTIWSSKEVGLREDCAGKVRHLVGHYYVCNF